MTNMTIKTTRVTARIKGEIENGPIVPLASWQSQGENRQVVGFTVELGFNKQEVDIRLNTVTLKKDGTPVKTTKTSAISSWDPGWESEAITELINRIDQMLLLSFPINDFLNARPQIHLTVPNH